MATTIRDLREKPLTELTMLYKNIFNNPAVKRHGHNIPTLDIIRAVILDKLRGRAYADHSEMESELNEGSIESVNKYPLTMSEFIFVYSKKADYGITDSDLNIKDFNISVYDELRTDGFNELMETKEESEQYIADDIINAREDELYEKVGNKTISRTELMELKQIQIHKNK